MERVRWKRCFGCWSEAHPEAKFRKKIPEFFKAKTGLS
jgi:hypothetical protein